MVALHDKAPDFDLPGSDGKRHSLKEFAGKYLVIYFYPKDDTPGCTVEAIGFTKAIEDLRTMGCEVVGISSDDEKSHLRFCEKRGLKHLLLSDESHETIKAYGAYGSRGIFGMGTQRKTYILDGAGTVIKIFEKVNPKGHEKEILDFIESTQKKR